MTSAAHVSPALGIIDHLSPASLLLVGASPAFGRTLREHARAVEARQGTRYVHGGTSALRLDLVADRGTPATSEDLRHFDRVFTGDATSELEKAPPYDVILLDGVLDALDPPERTRLLRVALEHSRKAVIVTGGTDASPGADARDPSSRRGWRRSDLREFPGAVFTSSASGTLVATLLKPGVIAPTLASRPLRDRIAGLAGRLVARLRGTSPATEPFDSASFWESRYRTGGNSGDGSYGPLALFKARFINDFVQEHGVQTVVEFGTGDGNQLSLLEVPRYTGLDVSPTAIEWLRASFGADPTKRFHLIEGEGSPVAGQTFDLSLSMDVIYHLVEDAVFERYMRQLFESSHRYVIIYASDRDNSECAHVRDRAFTRHVATRFPDWRLLETVPNEFPEESRSSFFVYCLAEDSRVRPPLP